MVAHKSFVYGADRLAKRVGSCGDLRAAIKTIVQPSNGQSVKYWSEVICGSSTGRKEW